MKTGKTILQLAEEITRQQAAKKDFLVDTKALEMAPTAEDGASPGVSLSIGGAMRVGVGKVAHDQIGSHAGIPAKYYDRMLAEAPGLLVANVNWWMHQNPSRQMVRTLDGKARAFLSDRYRPMDNAQLAEAVLPVLSDLGCEILSSEITESRLYIKAVDKSVMREIPAGKHMGDGGHTIVRLRALSPSVTISNSEVGQGSLRVDGGTFDSFCTNLAIFGERSMKRYHVGQKHGEFSEEQTFAMLSDQTRALSDAALWATIRDVVRGAFDVARFDALVAKVTASQDQPINGDVPKVVELAAQRFGFNDGERKSVLDHLIRGGDLSRFGLYNAVTRTAEDLEDYDRATAFERMGGQVLELASNDWRQMAEAA